MREDFVEIYDNLNDARTRMNEINKEYENTDLDAVIQPFDDENNEKKYGIFLEKDNLEYVGFLFGPDDVYYERCKKLINILKKNVPFLEWEKKDDEMKEFEEIWQFGSVPVKAYITKENANYVLRVRDFGEEFNIAKVPKKFIKPYEKLLDKEVAASQIVLMGGKLKKKRKDKTVCFEYEYQIEYTYGYEKNK